MELFRIWFYNNFDWLYTKIHENLFFFIDYWSFIHLWAGFIAFIFLVLINSKKPFKQLLIILTSYEIFEIVLRFILFNIIEPETFKDQITDILVGMIGGYLGFYLLRLMNKYDEENKVQYLQTFTIVFTSVTISFLWVGFYGYKYTAAYLNTNGLNITTFLAWSFGIIYIIFLFQYIYSKTRKKILSLIFIYIIYIPNLFLFEYFNYHIWKVNEISTLGRRALIFDIIHGTTTLHIFYLSAPMISIIIYYMFERIFRIVLEKKKNPELLLQFGGK